MGRMSSYGNSATDYVERIRTIQPMGPYYLVGWSLGGALAMEVAHQLEQAGRNVAFLGLLDSYVPGFEDVVDDVHDTFQEKEGIDLDSYRQAIKELEGTRDEAASIVSRRAEETAILRAKMKPLDAMNTALKSLETIDMDHVGRFDGKTKEEFVRLIVQMRERLSAYEGRL